MNYTNIVLHQYKLELFNNYSILSICVSIRIFTMINSYTQDAYRSHELNIAMKTSSGDTIKLDFLNDQSSSMKYSQSEKGSSTSMSFSSHRAFSFSVKSNGIDTQDQKEIDAFMKTAQPLIDKFLKELSEDAPTSPVTKLAKDITAIFQPNKERDENNINNIKTNIVKLFDKALQEVEPPKALSQEDMIKKLFEETQKLLEKTLKEFDNFDKEIYA